MKEGKGKEESAMEESKKGKGQIREYVNISADTTDIADRADRADTHLAVDTRDDRAAEHDRAAVGTAHKKVLTCACVFVCVFLFVCVFVCVCVCVCVRVRVCL
jgi:hypothetical protein